MIFLKLNKNMEMTFEEYIEDAKSQLDCNASERYKKNNITYTYSNEDVDNNLEYFKATKNADISAYKALLYFNGYYNKPKSQQEEVLRNFQELAEKRKKEDNEIDKTLMYYIVFSSMCNTNYLSGILAKRYYGFPTEEQKKFCKIFGFRILTEEEFTEACSHCKAKKLIF